MTSRDMTGRTFLATGADPAGEPADVVAPFEAYRAPLTRAAELAMNYVEGLPERFVGSDPGAAPGIARALGGDLPERGEAPEVVIEDLARAADPGLTAMNGPRYFGFVIGGTLPAAMAADWLTAAWDQNAGLLLVTPAAALVETIAGRWLVDLLGLPAETSVGFTTGATTANLVCAVAARDEVLRQAGWDVEADGLQGAPRVTVVVGDEVHPSMLKALRIAGFGQATPRRIPVDEQGAMRPDALEAALDGIDGPTIVAAQAGNVNSGALDPIATIVPIVRRRPQRLAPRRRGVRPLGGGLAASPAPRRGPRGRRLRSHRRA